MDLIGAMRSEISRDPIMGDLVERYNANEADHEDRADYVVWYSLIGSNSPIEGNSHNTCKANARMLAEGAARLLGLHESFVVELEGGMVAFRSSSLNAITVSAKTEDDGIELL